MVYWQFFPEQFFPDSFKKFVQQFFSHAVFFGLIKGKLIT
jgi:hypothetical protein